MEEKQRFAIRQGGKTVGAGVVVSITEYGRTTNGWVTPKLRSFPRVNALMLGIPAALGPRLRGDERSLVLSLVTA